MPASGELMQKSRIATLTARGLVAVVLIAGAGACGGGSDDAGTAKLAAQAAADKAATEKIKAQAEADKAAADRVAAEKKAATDKAAADKAAADAAAAVVDAPAAAPVAAAAAADEVNFAMPDMRGQNLQVAQDKVQALGVFFSVSHDVIASRMQMLDSNWKICTQTPTPGTRIKGAAADWEGKIDFGAVKLTESCP
jgi:hypothetical protein